MHKKQEELGKDWVAGEHDHEGLMAVAQLHRIVKMGEELLDMIGENDELEGWVQFKLSRAYNDMSDMFSYLEYVHSSSDDAEYQVVDDVLEGKKKKKKKKGLWDNIWAKRRRGERPARPGEKGYPKTLNIESSLARKAIRDLIQKEIKE